MRIVIWGAGIWGQRMLLCFKDNSKHEVAAFIDTDVKKVENQGLAIPIISYEEYKENYSDCAIIISISSEKGRSEVEKLLNEDGNVFYFRHIECPSEMIFNRIGGIPFDEIISELGLNNLKLKVAISGNTIFSILLYDYLEQKGYNSVCLIREKENCLYKKLVKCGYQYEETKNVEESYDVVLHTEGEYKSKLTEEQSVKHMQCHTFSFLERYRNLEIERFRNIHKNKKRCFIVASGPSLRMEDLNRLKENNEFSISMNRVYLAFGLTEWRPDVYVVSDGKGLLDNSQDLIDLEVDTKFFSDASEEFWIENKEEIEAKDNIYKYHLNGKFYIKGYPDFATDLTRGTNIGGSVVYDCIQWAVFMGFEKIYLIGVDFSFKKTGNTDDDHFVKGYAATARQAYYYDGLEWQHRAYQVAKKYADAHGINIYNATRGGKLEVFERVDFDSLF